MPSPPVPLKVAMMVCVPAVRVLVVIIAWPALTPALPIIPNWSVNVTVPVAGIPVAVVIVAVSVTVCPIAAGLGVPLAETVA